MIASVGTAKDCVDAIVECAVKDALSVVSFLTLKYIT